MMHGPINIRQTFLLILGTQHSFTHIPALNTLPYIATASDGVVRHTCNMQDYGNVECPSMSAIWNCNNVHRISRCSTTGWQTTVADGSCLSSNFGISVAVSVKVHGEEQVTFLGHLRRGLPKLSA